MNITAINGRPCPLAPGDLLNRLARLGQTVREGETERFWNMVEQLRDAQKRYFRTRKPLDLVMAKSWEKYVDEALREHGPPEPPEAVQNELFEGGTDDHGTHDH
jgi:hypothetical protein